MIRQDIEIFINNVDNKFKVFSLFFVGNKNLSQKSFLNLMRMQTVLIMKKWDNENLDKSEK